HSWRLRLRRPECRLSRCRSGTGRRGRWKRRSHWAACGLDLELVGKCRTMQFVLVVHGEVVAEFHGVVAGPLAARLADTTGGGTHVGPGPAEVETSVSELLEGRLELVIGGTQKDQVSG